MTIRILRKGEQIREGLDNGLKKSEFGVIVLSKNYFIKGWTRLELNALVHLSVYTKKIIIPIWYGVNKRDVIAFSVMISTINAFQSSDGIDKIASGIYDIIKSTDKNQPIQSNLDIILISNYLKFRIKDSDFF